MLGVLFGIVAAVIGLVIFCYFFHKKKNARKSPREVAKLLTNVTQLRKRKTMDE